MSAIQGGRDLLIVGHGTIVTLVVEDKDTVVVDTGKVGMVGILSIPVGVEEEGRDRVQ